MGSATSETGSGCVSYDAQASAATPAATYTATVIYTAVPTFSQVTASQTQGSETILGYLEKSSSEA